MTLPEQGPATSTGVRRLQKVAETGEDAALLEVCVAAANAFVRDLPVVRSLDVDDTEIQFPANVVLGADMLASRIYRRKNSPGGVEVMGDLGPLYVSRSDPDITMLLQLRKPAVG